MAKPDIYQQITNQIIKSLEEGVKPWVKPWQSGNHNLICRPLRHNFTQYTGINILILWLEAERVGHSYPVWMTYKQAEELGGQIRKGEKGTNIVYANTYCKKEENEEGKEEISYIPYLKTYTVFNVAQIDNLPEAYYKTHQPEPRINVQERIEHADRFFCNTKANINHGGNRAYFSPSNDYIQMPAFESFSSNCAYTATLAHEMIHWTGHNSRLDRLTLTKFGTPEYAKEELVAELGAAFLCADLEIPPLLENHASYIDSWLTVLKKDKRLIFHAASKAQQAAEYLHSLQQ